MHVNETMLQNVYEITMYEHEHGKYEFLRTYILLFPPGAPVESDLKKLESISCGDDLEVYLQNEEYSFNYLLNYDPISVEKFLELEEPVTEVEVIPSIDHDDIPF